MATAAEEEDAVLAMRRALQRLCSDYAELADEAAEFPQPVDERIGLALFKIDEASAVADRLRADADQAQAHVLEALVANCNELEDIFLRINLIERFVTRMLETARALEKRTEAVARAADPVFNAGSMTNMLRRSLSLKRSAQDTAGPAVKWEPIDFDFSTEELLQRLERSDARELGVSISSPEPPAAAAAPTPAQVSDAESDSD